MLGRLKPGNWLYNTCEYGVGIREQVYTILWESPLRQSGSSLNVLARATFSLDNIAGLQL
jgi:hypothetical protein